MMVQREFLIANERACSSTAEAYRIFCTNLQYLKVDREIKSILVTSSHRGEGRSITAANTAIILAQAGRSVILIDADLRRPTQHLTFGRIATGVTNILLGQGRVEDYLQRTDIPNLRLLTSGPLLPNPAELLGTDRMTELLADLRSQADYLIIDSPPVLPVTDARILAAKVDGVVLVLGSGSVRSEEAVRTKAALEQVEGFLLGFIINRIATKESSEDYSAYYRQSKTTRFQIKC